MQNLVIKDELGGPFKDKIKLLREEGFNPLAATSLMNENCFAFKTEEEANQAYHKLERDLDKKWIGTLTGWWYSEKRFWKTLEEYKDLGPFEIYLLTD